MKDTGTICCTYFNLKGFFCFLLAICMIVVVLTFKSPLKLHRMNDTAFYNLTERVFNLTNLQKLSKCNFTKSAWKDTSDSYHNRHKTNTDTRPRIIFGQSDLYRDKQEFDHLNKVPHIIHQSYHIGELSVIYQKWMQSWLKINPGWQYWFWTIEDINRLIKVRYPKFKSIFKKYGLNIQRYDAFRYFALYEYGGFYADLDVECLKPLDIKIAEHNCILSVEPGIHSLIIYKDRLS